MFKTSSAKLPYLIIKSVIVMGGNPDYKAISDDQLIHFLKNSDSKAFSEIFRRYRSVLLLYTYRRVKDTERSKDLIHDAFVNIWSKRDALDIPGELRSYLITVIKNRILDYYKRARVSQRYLDDFDTYLSLHDDTTDHRIRHNELSSLIEKEVAALPKKMRMVFELSRNEHMSRKEISDYLDVSEENVKTNMRRALKILKDRFGELLMLLLLTFN